MPFHSIRKAFLLAVAACALLVLAPVSLARADEAEMPALQYRLLVDAARAHAAQAPSPDFPAIDPKKGYAVNKLAGKAYWVTDGVYESMFAVTPRGVVVMDAPPTIGGKLVTAIRSVTRKPVRWFIYSHAHADHVGSAHLFRGATFIAQRDTADLLRAAHDHNRPVPTRTFATKLNLDLGGERIDLRYPGPNHEDGNSFIWLPRERVLMAVDIVFAGHVPFKNLAVSSDIPGWIKAHDQILRYPFRRLLGGHFGLSTRADVIRQRAYVQDLRKQAAAGLVAVDFPALAQQIGFTQPWRLFDAYLDATAQYCAQRVLPTWSPRLQEADVFTEDNCFTMAESLRIDSDVLGPFGEHA